MTQPISLPVQRPSVHHATPAAKEKAKSWPKVKIAAEKVVSDPRVTDAAHQAASTIGTAVTAFGGSPEVGRALTAGVLSGGETVMIKGAKDNVLAARRQWQKTNPEMIQKLKDIELSIVQTLRKNGVPEVKIDEIEQKFASARSLSPLGRTRVADTIRDVQQALQAVSGEAGDAAKVNRELSGLLGKYEIAARNATMSRLENVTKGGDLLASGAAVIAKGGAYAAAVSESSVAAGISSVASPLTLGIQTVASGANAVKNIVQADAVAKDIELHEANETLGKDVRRSIAQELRQQKRLHHHAAKANGITAAGRATAIGSTFIPEPGTQVVAKTVALAATGGGAVYKNVVEGKMARAAGKMASDNAKSYLASLTSVETVMLDEGVDEALRQEEGEYRFGQDLAAETKLTSHILKKLDKSAGNSEPHDPVVLRKEVRKSLAEQQRANWKMTTLVAGDIKRARQIFKDEYPVSFFEGTNSEIYSRICDKITEKYPLSQNLLTSPTFQKSIIAKTIKNVDEDTVAAVKEEYGVNINRLRGHSSRVDNWNTLKSIAARNKTVDEVFMRAYAKLLIKQLKEDGKFLRAGARNKILEIERADSLLQQGLAQTAEQ